MDASYAGRVLNSLGTVALPKTGKEHVSTWIRVDKDVGIRLIDPKKESASSLSKIAATIGSAIEFFSDKIGPNASAVIALLNKDIKEHNEAYEGKTSLGKLIARIMGNGHIDEIKALDRAPDRLGTGNLPGFVRNVQGSIIGDGSIEPKQIYAVYQQQNLGELLQHLKDFEGGKKPLEADTIRRILQERHIPIASRHPSESIKEGSQLPTDELRNLLSSDVIKKEIFKIMDKELGETINKDPDQMKDDFESRFSPTIFQEWLDKHSV